MKKVQKIVLFIFIILSANNVFSFEIVIDDSLTRQRDDGSMLYDVWFRIYRLESGDSIEIQMSAYTSALETLTCETFITPCNIGIVRSNGLKHIVWDIGNDCSNREFRDNKIFVKLLAKVPNANLNNCNFEFYLTDHSTEIIYNFPDFDDIDWIEFGSEGAGVGEFDHLNHIHVDNDGVIYVGDEYNNRVVKIENMDGDGWTVASFSHSRPTKCYPRDGYFYVIERDNSLTRYDSFSDLTPEVYYCPESVEFYDLEFDDMGRIYLLDRGGEIYRIDDFTGAGLISYDASEHGGIGAPFDMCLDILGRIYIADRFGHRIFRIDDMTGTNFIEYGTSGTGVGEFSEPTGICVDEDLKIYISDWMLSRLVRIDNMDGDNWTMIDSSPAHVLTQPWSIFIRYF